MRDFSQGHRWLSINTATVRRRHGHELPLPDILDACARRGIRAIAPWRDQVEVAGLSRTSRLVKELGFELSSYCYGGFYPAVEAAGLLSTREDGRRCVDEACELNAACLVLACAPRVGRGDHEREEERIAALLGYARQNEMPLAIEPLHPMYAACCHGFHSMEQALDVCDKLDPACSGALGVAVDLHHVWWDPKLQSQIQRAGKKRLLAFQVCDWLAATDTRLLNGRGMMGDGVIDIPKIRGWAEDAGFGGYSEVEIFSESNWWQRDTSEVLDTCVSRHGALT